MRKMTLGLITLTIVLPVLLFAQTAPQPPASWLAFQKEEAVKKIAFFQQMKSDRDSFLSTHPDVQAYFNQIKANAQARMAQWKAAHPNQNPRFARKHS